MRHRYIEYLDGLFVTTKFILMNETELLVEKIKEAIQDKKGKKVVIVDLREIVDRICDFFVICEGNTPTQVSAIYDNVEDYVRREIGEKPSKIAGSENCLWVAMDYVDVMVHIFVPEMRSHYNLEHLWADAKIVEVPDLD